MHRLCLLLTLLLAAPAASEGFADLYGGGAFPDDDRGFAVPGFSTGPRTDFDSTGVVGGRIGAWSDGFPYLGGALDVSWFGPDGEGRTSPAELDVIPISFLLMGRVPLVTSEEYPGGRVQPYLGIGPSLVVSQLEIPLPGPDFDDTEADAGVDLRVGTALIPVRPLGLFLEYRFTHFEPDWEDRVGTPVAVRSRASTELSTHLVQAGVSLRF